MRVGLGIAGIHGTRHVSAASSVAPRPFVAPNARPVPAREKAMALQPKGAISTRADGGRNLSQWPNAHTNRYSEAYGTSGPEVPQEGLAARMNAYSQKDPTGAITTATREFTADTRNVILLRVFHGVIATLEDDPVLRLADLEYIDDNDIKVEIVTYTFGNATPQLAAPLTPAALTQFTRESRVGGMVRATRAYEMDWGSMYHTEGKFLLQAMMKEMQKASLKLVKRMILYGCFNSPRHYARVLDIKEHARDIHEFFEAAYAHVGQLNGTPDGHGLSRMVDRAYRLGKEKGVEFEFGILGPGVKTVLTQANPHNFEYLYAGPAGPGTIKKGSRARLMYGNMEITEDDSAMPGQPDAFFRHGVSVHEASLGQAYSELVLPSDLPQVEEWNSNMQTFGLDVEYIDNFACVKLWRAAKGSGAFQHPGGSRGERCLTDNAPSWMLGMAPDSVDDAHKLNFDYLYARIEQMHASDAERRQWRLDLVELAKYMAIRLAMAVKRSRATPEDPDTYQPYFPAGLYRRDGSWSHRPDFAATAKTSAAPVPLDEGPEEDDDEEEEDVGVSEAAKGKRTRRPHAEKTVPSKKRRGGRKASVAEEVVEAKQAAAAAAALVDVDSDDEALRAMVMDTAPGGMEPEAAPLVAAAAADMAATVEAAAAVALPDLGDDAFPTGVMAPPGAALAFALIWRAVWCDDNFRAWQRAHIPIPVGAYLFRQQQWFMADSLFVRGRGEFVKAFLGPPRFHHGKNVTTLKASIHYDMRYGVHIVDGAKGISFANSTWIRYQSGGNATFLGETGGHPTYDTFLNGMADIFVVMVPPWVTRRDCPRYVPIAGEIDTSRDFMGTNPPRRGMTQIKDFFRLAAGAFESTAAKFHVKAAMDTYPSTTAITREYTERNMQEMGAQRNAWFAEASALVYDKGTRRASRFVSGYAATGDVAPGYYAARNIVNCKPVQKIPISAVFECIDDV